MSYTKFTYVNPAGSSPNYRIADVSIAFARPRVLVIDTHLAMPCYNEGVELGYYADTTHYATAGTTAWLKKGTDLLLQCASRFTSI